jgi:hypothetical protein
MQGEQRGHLSSEGGATTYYNYKPYLPDWGTNRARRRCCLLARGAASPFILQPEHQSGPASDAQAQAPRPNAGTAQACISGCSDQPDLLPGRTAHAPNLYYNPLPPLGAGGWVKNDDTAAGRPARPAPPLRRRPLRRPPNALACKAGMKTRGEAVSSAAGVRARVLWRVLGMSVRYRNITRSEGIRLKKVVSSFTPGSMVMLGCGWLCKARQGTARPGKEGVRGLRRIELMFVSSQRPDLALG